MTRKKPPASSADLGELFTLVDEVALAVSNEKIGNSGEEDLGALKNALRSLLEKTQAQAAAQAQVQAHLDRAFDMIASLAGLDFSKTLPVHGDGSSVEDGLATGLNMLSEELKYSIVSKRQLEEKNALIQSIIENMPAVFFLKDATDGFKVTFCNKAAEETLELSRAEVLGKSVHEIWPKELADGFHEADLRVCERGIIDVRVESFDTKGRGKVWLETKKVPLRLGVGRDVTHLLVIASDVTETKKREDHINNLNSQLRLIADNIPGAVSRVDRQGRYTFINKTYTVWFGKSQAQILGHTYGEFLPPELAAKTAHHIKRALAGERLGYETDFIAAQGNKVDAYVNYFPQFDEKGEPDGYITVALDISEIRLLQTSLRNESKRHQMTVSALNATSIVAFTDRAGKITYANQKFCEISGYSETELIGNSHSLINSGYHSKEFFKGLWSTIASKKIWRGEVCNRGKHGRFYWVDTTIIPVLNAEGEVEQYVAIRHDITQRKLAEQASIQSAKMASLGEMAGGIAHEINNPLGIVQGKSMQLLKMIQRGKFTPEYGAEELEKIVDTSERIARIVKGLRSFSRNAEKDPVEPFELRTLIENILGLCSERLKAHRIRLEVGPIPALTLQCRAVQLEQVLLNLLNNAYDAVLPLSEKWIRITTEVRGENILIAVTDSGYGIPPYIVDKLMQPFFTTKEVGKGTGLGLSLSKGIVEDHNGQLRYEPSCPNTCFVVELPLAQKDDAKAAV